MWGWGAWAGSTAQLQGCPSYSCSAKCHLSPPKELQALAQCPTLPTHAGHVPPGGQGRFLGAFPASLTHLQAAGRRRLAAALISSFIFTLKRLWNCIPCPAQHQGGSQGMVTTQTEGSITDALSSSTSCLAGAPPD